MGISTYRLSIMCVSLNHIQDGIVASFPSCIYLGRPLQNKRLGNLAVYEMN
jgi:hypothetical protein